MPELLLLLGVPLVYLLTYCGAGPKLDLARSHSLSRPLFE